jgi:hypothetical protein
MGLAKLRSVSKTLLFSLVSRLIGTGVLVTLATGLILVRRGTIEAASLFDYGLPFAWRETLVLGGSSTTPRLYFLLFDVLFYMAFGYVVVTAYWAKRGRRETKAMSWFLVAVGYVVTVTVIAAWIYSQPPVSIP